MQRDLEIIREILHKISAAPGRRDQSLLVWDKSPAETRQILYQVALLNDAGLLAGQPFGNFGQENPVWMDLDLTWAGHDFLDAVRDPEIWQQTRNGLKSAGAFTFVLAKALAQGFIKKKIEEQTGIKLELGV